MKRCALQRELNRIAARADREEEKAIAAARLKYVVPFCDRTGYKLSAGMGSWSFHRGDDMLNTYDMLPVRLRAVMEAETLTGQSAGSLMQDYTPKNFNQE